MVKTLIQYVFLSLIFMYSCSESNDDFQKLPQDKMREILVDIHLHEAMSEVIAKGNPDSIRIQILLSYDEIFEKHGVEADLFFKNVDYYMFSKLDEFDVLYQSVIEDLNVIHAEKSAKKSRKESEEDDDNDDDIVE